MHGEVEVGCSLPGEGSSRDSRLSLCPAPSLISSLLLTRAPSIAGLRKKKVDAASEGVQMRCLDEGTESQREAHVRG